MPKQQKQPIFLIQGAIDWTRIESIVQNAVVQVFAQVGSFNWLEPYKVEEEAENRGSGFLIDRDGYIITNAHVVDEAKRIWVHIPILGRQMILVEVVGFCPDRDLALLRIVPEKIKEIRKLLGEIPFLTFGDSDQIARTDNVMVLGYPLGQYRLKSSTGVVSGRESSGGQAFIQFTAAISEGSSGGPLLNEIGQVVGIAIAIAPEGNNVGYAIAINELKLILEELRTKKLVRIPMLGVQFVYSNDSKAEFLGNPKSGGLYIIKVLKNSLFEKAQVLVGDMLYEFNGFAIDAYGDTTAPWGDDKASLTDIMARIKIGQKVRFVIYRNGKKMVKNITWDLVDPYSIREMYPDYETVEYETIAGMVILQLADNHFPLLLETAADLICYAKPEKKIDPVLVITNVLPGSLAQQLYALLPGDIIRDVNGMKVTTLAMLRKAISASLKTGFLSITTERDIFAVFDIKSLLKDERELSRDFAYPLSATVQQLIKKIDKDKNS
ncbi:MAG: trypsin-like peptidase domain-containing protein [Candidatus Babeliales bacterium]|nr:trypsin-like peptidase domain-containing protein [Candidatus Babeliales bacterium]